MNIFTHLSLISAGVLLSSCVYYTPTVPDMPYGEVANRQYPDTWVVTPPATPNPGVNAVPGLAPLPSSPSMDAPIPAPRPTVAPAAASVPAPVTPTIPTLKPATPVSTTITSGANGKLTPTVAKPAAPTSAASPTSMAQRLATDPKSITNQGPIPVATRVEGDPTRVYNPLDPSKTIRVVDKNGKPYPSGKELKVRGTNFHFYVP